MSLTVAIRGNVQIVNNLCNREVSWSSGLHTCLVPKRSAVQIPAIPLFRFAEGMPTFFLVGFHEKQKKIIIICVKVCTAKDKNVHEPITIGVQEIYHTRGQNFQTSTTVKYDYGHKIRV